TLRLCAAKLATEVVCERVDPDTLYRLAAPMKNVELAAALSITKILPVGRFIAGAGKARLLDEGFEQNRAIRIGAVPVVGQATYGQREDPRREIATADPGQDEEACVVDDQM